MSEIAPQSIEITKKIWVRPPRPPPYMKGTPPPAPSPTTTFGRCLFRFSNPPFFGINNNSLTPLYFFSGLTPPTIKWGEYPPPPGGRLTE